MFNKNASNIVKQWKWKMIKILFFMAFIKKNIYIWYFQIYNDNFCLKKIEYIFSNAIKNKIILGVIGISLFGTCGIDIKNGLFI